MPSIYCNQLILNCTVLIHPLTAYTEIKLSQVWDANVISAVELSGHVDETLLTYRPLFLDWKIKAHGREFA